MEQLEQLINKYNLGINLDDHHRFYEGFLRNSKPTDELMSDLKNIVKNEFGITITLRKKWATYTRNYIFTIRNNSVSEIKKPWVELTSEEKTKYISCVARPFQKILEQERFSTILDDFGELYEADGTIHSTYQLNDKYQLLDMFMEKYITSCNYDHTGENMSDCDYIDTDFFHSILFKTNDWDIAKEYKDTHNYQNIYNKLKNKYNFY